MTLIQIEHVSKFYYMGGETIRALDDITLDISQGEFIAIMGPSGSGKSTLMNIMGVWTFRMKGYMFWMGSRLIPLRIHNWRRFGIGRLGSCFKTLTCCRD